MTDRQITAHGSFEALHRQYLKERDVASVNCRIAIYGFAQWLDERFRNTIETSEQHFTYDVVAYSESGQTGYGQNDSKEGFTSAEEAIAYAKSCDAYLNATVWQRTVPKPVERISVKLYPISEAPSQKAEGGGT